MQKYIFLILLGLNILVISELLAGKGGIANTYTLKSKIDEQLVINNNLKKRNDEMVNKIEALKYSPETLAAKARYELNLIKPGEVLVRLPKE